MRPQSTPRPGRAAPPDRRRPGPSLSTSRESASQRSILPVNTASRKLGTRISNTPEAKMNIFHGAGGGIMEGIMTARNSWRCEAVAHSFELGAVHALEQEQFPAGAAQPVRQQAADGRTRGRHQAIEPEVPSCHSRYRWQESRPWARECSTNRAPRLRLRPRSPISTAPAEAPASISPQCAQKKPLQTLSPSGLSCVNSTRTIVRGWSLSSRQDFDQNERIDREESSTEPAREIVCPERLHRMQCPPAKRQPK